MEGDHRMRDVKIFTDSTSDLTPEIIIDNNISQVPLYVNFEDKSFKDGIDINTTALYEAVKEKGKLPKTAAASPSDFYTAFKPYIDEGKDIIFISLSSKLSSNLQNAAIATSEFDKGRIELVDSLNLSTGIGLLVMKAVDYAKEGLDVHEIAGRIRELVPKVKTAFIIDTLEYLYKGGRCNALQNFFGNVLKIRPVVQVVNGSMILAQKIRGKRQKALSIMLQNVLKDKGNIQLDRITVTHSMSDEDAKYLKRELERAIPAKEIIITNAGCVVSSHCGPNTVGILYISK